ncbi:MAG TPA: DegT/DnrJ/EryC1/StrS family aminotransferase [Acidobacteriota bacterium]|nr:DegT/DnrJ/EryC1/StrS family aminotransferase [Acidobacteriota bacterium]
MQIPFVDLKAQYAAIRSEIEPAIANVLASCDFILGREVQDFEKKFCEYLGAKQVIGVGSGFDAIRLGLEVLGIKPGDEVLMPAHTFIATALAISSLGARPVLVDVSDSSFNIDPDLIEVAVTPRTKAVIAVHLYGQPCDMDSILGVARKHHVPVIEDACQAHGASYREKRAGTLGEMGCFSFYPAKNLGAYGDGGAIVTSEDQTAELLRRLRNYGQTRKYHHPELGTNSRLDSLQAAVLNVKLKHLDAWNQQRKKNAALYSQLLKPIGQIRTPEVEANRDHVYHLYVIRAKNRDALQSHLMQKGIATQIHYPIPIYAQEPYKNLGYSQNHLPVTTQICTEILSLPMYAELQPAQIEYVAASIRDFYR